MTNVALTPGISPRGRMETAFLWTFCAHRFYVGKTWTGILQLLTLGGIGAWWIVDLVLILSGSFRDKENRTLENWRRVRYA